MFLLFTYKPRKTNYVFKYNLDTGKHGARKFFGQETLTVEISIIIIIVIIIIVIIIIVIIIINSLLFSVKILNIYNLSLRNKYNKIFQEPRYRKIVGSFYTRTKTTIIYPVRKVLKILFRCFQKANIKDIVFTNSARTGIKFPHSYLTFISFK